MTADAPSIPAESLLRHRAFVQSLARSLVRDEHAAQDLVQETWLEAVRHPPRSAAALPAWLGRVVRTRAMNAARGEARRASREAIAAREEADESEVRLSARVAMQQKVVEAVLGLKEPYKSVVLLRYYEGLSPSAIAARRGVPGGTVRAQLSRAHDLLRERLDEEFGGSRAAWSVLLVEVARRRAAILLSTKAFVVAVSIAAAMLAGFFLFRHGGPNLEPAPVQVASGMDARSPDESALSTDSRAAARIGIEPDAAQSTPPAVAPIDWTVVGTVVDPAGHPATRAIVGLFAPPAHGAPPVLEKQTECDADGKFRLAVESGSDRLLSVVHPGSIPPTVAVTFGDSHAKDLGTLRLSPGETLSGTVVDASTKSGMSTASVYVSALEGGYARCGPMVLAWVERHFVNYSLQTSCDGKGGFSLQGLENGAYRLQVDPSPPGSDTICALPGVEGNVFQVRAPSKDLRLEFRAPRLVLSVTAMGRPVPRASYVLRSTAKGVASSLPMTCNTDDRGHATVLLPADVDLEFEVWATGFEAQRSTVAAGFGEVLRQEVELQPGDLPGRLQLELSDAPGSPVDKISFGFFEADRDSDRPLFTRDGVTRSKAGSFDAQPLPPKRYRVDVRVTNRWGSAYDTCYVPLAFELDLHPHESLRIQKSLQLGGRVRVRVRNAEGDSLGAAVTFKDSAASAIPVWFVQSDAAASMKYRSTWRPHESRAHPEQFVDVQPAFAEGSYSVEVKLDGFATKTETFRIEKGKVTDLDYTLDPVR